MALYIRGIGTVKPWENIVTYKKIFQHQSQHLAINILKKDGSSISTNMYINTEGNLLSELQIEEGDTFIVNHRIYYGN